MKRLGLVLSFAAAFQFIAGEAHLCCCWNLVLPGSTLAINGTSPEKQASITGVCANCPQSPAHVPSSGCSCPSFSAAEGIASNAIFHASQDRSGKAFEVLLPPLEPKHSEVILASTLKSPHYPPLGTCAAYLRHSTLLI